MICAINLESFFATQKSVVQIAITQVRGSAPRDSGTEMFVAATACLGTIGGGQLEHRAVRAARALLKSQDRSMDLTMPLGPEIGQCCGGHVTLELRDLSREHRITLVQNAQADEHTLPHVYIFGAGHVGRALATALQNLPFAICLIDSRQTEIAQADPAVPTKVTPLPEADIRQAPPGSAYVILTHDHSLDFQLTAEALARQDASYVGMIGSKTKRAAFLHWARTMEKGLNTDGLTCPIGANSVANKAPEVIAAFVTAELLTALDRP